MTSCTYIGILNDTTTKQVFESSLINYKLVRKKI